MRLEKLKIMYVPWIIFLLGMAVLGPRCEINVFGGPKLRLNWFAGRVVKTGVRILESQIPAPVLPSLSPSCFHNCCAIDHVCCFLCPGHQGSWTCLPPGAIKCYLLYTLIILHWDQKGSFCNTDPSTSLGPQEKHFFISGCWYPL